ncbi:hypothetical protein ACWGNM_03405 [Streptomyces sp. NPDC055796]
MSHNQSGPYGRQPEYGAAPGGFQPYQPAPRRKAGLIVSGVVVALAVIAGGAYFAFGGDADDDGGGIGDSASNSEISDGTKGYTLVAPASVEAYKKSGPGNTPGELSAEQRKEAESRGVSNARAASGIYNAESTDADDPAKVGGRRLTFDGLYGEIADPARALDDYFANVAKKGLKGDGKPRGLVMQRVGSPRAVKPAGFEGALMKCQDVKVTHDKGVDAPKSGAADFQFPVCAWADRSTLGGVNVIDLAQPMTGGSGPSQEEVAALTVKLYKAARQKA